MQELRYVRHKSRKQNRRVKQEGKEFVICLESFSFSQTTALNFHVSVTRSERKWKVILEKCHIYLSLSPLLLHFLTPLCWFVPRFHQAKLFYFILRLWSVQLRRGKKPRWNMAESMKRVSRIILRGFSSRVKVAFDVLSCISFHYSLSHSHLPLLEFVSLIWLWRESEGWRKQRLRSENPSCCLGESDEHASAPNFVLSGFVSLPFSTDIECLGLDLNWLCECGRFYDDVSRSCSSEMLARVREF